MSEEWGTGEWARFQRLRSRYGAVGMVVGLVPGGIAGVGLAAVHGEALVTATSCFANVLPIMILGGLLGAGVGIAVGWGVGARHARRVAVTDPDGDVSKVEE
ncbi:MAG: hypothetical protein GF393_08115 [Armatimonadia bacterium]|nr:hypothetical protein [Armatimonadia bacterium]